MGRPAATAPWRPGSPRARTPRWPRPTGATGPWSSAWPGAVLRDELLAEDVTQEVFTYLWEHPERFDPSRGTLKAWVGLLAHRRSVDKVRAENRRARSEARTLDPPSVEPTAEHDLDTQWICAQVRRALETLPPEQRQVLVCAYYGGRTYRQVAKQLSIPEGTAKSRIRLALARLNEILRAEITEEGVPAWT